jgi:hypothetical protein
MSDKNNGGSEEEVSVLYIHLYSSGAIFFCPGDTGVTMEGDISRLKAELTRLQECEQALVNFTTDPVEDEESAEFFETVLRLIDECGIYTQAMMYPHPEVYGYYKSYVPYIMDACEAAELDVDGTERMIFICKEMLEKAKDGTEEHDELATDLQALEKQLADAKHAFSRLKEVELELCAEAEGHGEH